MVGKLVGLLVGNLVGSLVGKFVGSRVGFFVGSCVGLNEGLGVAPGTRGLIDLVSTRRNVDQCKNLFKEKL